jgi:carbon dioxide concentrating mechanism protein CcmN
MHSPPLQLHPVSTTHYFVGGDVTIHEGAAIAPGVLLQADPNSRLVIGVGVCIGMSSVIHARGGTLEIGEGAIIGAGVLIAGDLKVGDRACIGSATTIVNQSIESGALIPPSSLLCANTPLSASQSPQADASSDPWDEPTEKSLENSFSNNGQPKAESFSNPFSQNGQPPHLGNDQPKDAAAKEESPTASHQTDSSSDSSIVPRSNLQPGVYGQVYVNQLLGKLFPGHPSNHQTDRSAGNGSSENNSSQS